MAYGRKYYKEFDGYNAATRQSYTVLVDIYEDGFSGAAIEIEEISASPLQLSLDSSGDPLYTAIKKTSATFNIINTNQFDYSEFYTSNAKKYKMMITSTVFNWTGYLVPQAVSFDLATNGEFSLTASDGLHLLQSIDYVAAENDMTTLADFLTDIETKIGLSTFNRTSTIKTEYGDIWNSLIYEGMFTNKTYEEAFEMVLKSIGMQVRYWKITPIISMESALQTASVKCVNDYPELNFLAPIKTAKLTKNITTLPSAFKNALVDDASDLNPRVANSYNTLTNWTVVSDNGLVVFDIGANETDRKANKYKYINMFVKPTNAPYDDQRLTGNEGSYFQLRPVQKTPFTLSFNANFGNISSWGRSSADGYRSYVDPVKWSSIKWGLYDSISNKSYSKTTNSWSITGTPTAANANELKVTDPADSFVDVYIPIPEPSGITANLRFYLFTGEVEYDSSAPGGSKTNRLSIKSIDIDGEYVVSENELYTAVNGAVAVGDNIDVLDYDVDFGSVPTPPLNTSLYYGSAFFDNNLNQLEDIIIGANTVSHEQYLFNTILYTQNEIRKKVYTANVNMLTNVSPFWLKTTLKTDTVMVNACSFDFKTSQLNGEFTEIMPYVYRAWSITSESEIGSSDWGGSGGQTGTSGGGGTVDTSNFVVKTGATDQTIEGIVRPDNLLSNGAVVAKSLAPTDVNEWPQAGTGVDGVIKYDGTTLDRNAQGQLYVKTSGGTVVNWGTEVAGQSVQLIVAAITKSLALAGHTHSQYLTAITKSMVEAVLTGNITTHTHSQYLLSSLYTAADVLAKLLTVDGTGSGLDADMLDGVQGNMYFSYRDNVATATNADNLTNMGMWLNTTGNGTGNSNFPSTYGYIQSFSMGDVNYGKWQMSVDNTADNIHIRAEWAGTWGGWKKLWHSGNSNLKTVDWSAKDLSAVNGYYDGAVVAKYLSSTYSQDWPIAGSNVYGTIKYDPATLSLNGNGQLTVIGGGWSNVAWGTVTGQYAQLTVDSVTRNLSLDGHTHSYLPLSGGTVTGAFEVSAPIYTTEWFRNKTSGCGLYNEVEQAHWYASAGFWNATKNILVNGATVWHAGNLSIGAENLFNNGGKANTYSSSLEYVYGLKDDEQITVQLWCDSGSTATISCFRDNGYALNGSISTTTGYGKMTYIVKPYTQNAANNGTVLLIITAANAKIKVERGNQSTDMSYSWSDYLTSNVASATKLANTRTIWGQSFNGEADVNGTVFTNIGVKSRNICIETDNLGNAGSLSSEINNFNSHLFLQHSTANNTIICNGGGNVGIGTTSPSYKLDINGTFRAVGAGYFNSTLDVATSVTSPSFIGNASTATRLNSARTFALTGDVTGSITSDLLSGVSIATAIQPNSVALGTDTTGNYAGSVLVSGNGLSITGVAGEGTAFTVVSNATSLNTASTIMFRDASGDYHARNGLHDGALVAKYLSSTFATDWPVMTASVLGVAKAGSSLISNAGTLDQRRRHYTTVSAYTDAAARDITAKIPLGTGNMTSGTLDQIKLDFAPLTTTFGLTANVIVTQTGAGMGLIVSFREDSGTGRWYICIYNPTGATVVRDGIYLSINAKQTV